MIGPRKPGGSLSAAFLILAWFTACAIVLQLFKWYDWGQGLVRGLLLVALAIIAGVPAALAVFRRRLSDSGRLRYEPIPWLGIAAVGFVVLGFGYHLHVGLRTLSHSIAEHRVWLDQGENSVRALRLLFHGVNPFGKHTMLDPVAYEQALRKLTAKPSCALSPTAHLKALSDHFWEDPVVRLDEMERLSPSIAELPECRELRLQFDSVAYKYGPVLLASYAPFVALLGDAGIYVAHILLFIALSALTALLAYKMANGDLFLASLPFVVLYLPRYISSSTLSFAAVDLAPTLLSVLALSMLTFSKAKRVGALGSAVLGLSICAKLAPGIFYLPLLSRLKPREWVLAPIIVALVVLPFLIWDPVGISNNLVLFNFSRLVDSTTPMYFLDPTSRAVVKLVVIAGLAALAIIGIRQRWPLSTTLAFVTFAHLGAMGISLSFHNNYLVWVLPVLGLWMLDTTTRLLTRP